jgi:hypothetical protein
VLGQALALEDVAAGQPDLTLDVGRTEHLDVLDRVLEPAAEAADRGDREPPDLVAPRVPPTVEVVGTYWANTLIRCLPGGAIDGSNAVCR